MAYHEMLESEGEIWWKSLNLTYLFLYPLNSDNHVPQKPSSVGIIELQLVGKFFNFAYVVENGPSDKQVSIQPGVVVTDSTQEFGDRNSMFEETTQIGMMHGLGSWRLFHPFDKVSVSEEALQKTF
jgi:hypothetical protein